MAYQIKYRITSATKANVTSILNIYEDGYVGDIIEYPCVSMQMQYIPRSDDAFEPIYASLLNAIIDVTDDVSNMPDFTTLDDRKYFVRLFSESNLDWQGWVLSDNVQYLFSTGRKELAFTAIDGLGMLERIPLDLPSDYTLVANNTLIVFISSCLSKLQYPLTYNIISGISFYAEGMNNRDDNVAADPLNQTYANYATFVNDNQEPTNCLDVLTQIVKSFGARLFQSRGNFYIVPLTQFAQDSYYSTVYLSNGTVFGGFTQDLTGNIEGFTGNTSGLFFVDNSQFKLIRKGYNKIRFNKQIEYPSNYITNWDLKNYTVISPTEGNAYAWSENRNGGFIFIKSYPNKKYNTFYVEYGPSPYYASVSPNFLPKVNSSDIIKLTFDVVAINAPASGPDALFILIIKIDDGIGSVFLDDNKQWIDSAFNDHYYYLPFNPSDPKANVELTLPAAPISGDLTIELLVCADPAPYWKSTVNTIEASNFKLEVETYFKEVTTESFISDSEEYVLDVDLPLGFNDSNDGFFNYKGFLSDSTGATLKNWYRQEFQDETYRSLSELVVKQYSNVLNKNIINLDASFMGMETTDGRFCGAMMITASDTDPSQISVSNKKYIIGNSTIDLPNDVISATLLDINPNNIETTMTTIYDNNRLSTTPTGYGHLRSNGFLTREEAYAAPLTSNILYLQDIGVPDIGDVYYTDEALNNPFNGAALWWKVMTTDTSFRAFKISSSGVILEAYG